jgi:hypothetical protein
MAKTRVGEKCGTFMCYIVCFIVVGLPVCSQPAPQGPTKAVKESLITSYGLNNLNKTTSQVGYVLNFFKILLRTDCAVIFNISVGAIRPHFSH